MNKAGLIGIILAIAIATFSILDSTKNPMVFADLHGIILVIGGTLTVALISFNFQKLFGALKVLARKTLGKEKDDFTGTIKIISDLSEVYRANPKNLMASVPAHAHPFLKDAISLVVDYGFSVDEVEEILSNAMRGKKNRDEEENKVWQTVARFPPAFGLLGATLGMISLLQTLGEPGAQDRIGPAMATALVATFYGLVVANLVLLPIAEKLGAVASSDRTLRMIIKEGVIMIVEKRHPAFISEYLQSFLAPRERMNMSKESGQGGARAA